MCGIVGYTGDQQAAPILLAGLEKLEYRGGGQDFVHGKAPGQRPHVDLPDRRGTGGAYPDRHRRMEYPCG